MEEDKEDCSSFLDSEIYFLILKFLEGNAHLHGESVAALRSEIESNALLGLARPAFGNGEGSAVSVANFEGQHRSVTSDYLRSLLAQLIRVRQLSEPLLNVPLNTLLGTGQFALFPSESNANDALFPTSCHNAPARGVFSYTLHRQLNSSSMRPAQAVGSNIRRTLTLLGHLYPVYCVAFDRSGTRVLTAADDGNVKVWDIRVGLLLGVLRGHAGTVQDIALNFGNTLVATASSDFDVRVWNLQSFATVAVLVGHRSAVLNVWFSPDDRHLVSFSDSGTMRVWLTENQFTHAPYICINSSARRGSTRDEVAPAPSSSAPSPAAAAAAAQHAVGGEPASPALPFNLNNDNANAAAALGNPALPPLNDIIVCDTMYTDDAGKGYWSAFDRSGVFFAVSVGNVIRIWSLAKPVPECIAELKGHRGTVTHVSFSHNDSRLLCSAGAEVRIWDWVGHLEENERQSFVRTRSGLSSPKANAKDKRWSCNVLRATLDSRNAASYTTELVAWSTEDRLAIASCSDQRMRIWNANTLDHVFSLAHQEHITLIKPHPFDPRLFLTGDFDGSVILWDLYSGEKVFSTVQSDDTLLAVYNTPCRTLDGDFSPSGDAFVVTDMYGRVTLYSSGPSFSGQEPFSEWPTEQFLQVEERPLVYDDHHWCLDEQSDLPLHLVPRGPLCQWSDGTQTYAPHDVQPVWRSAPLAPTSPEEIEQRLQRISHHKQALFSKYPRLLSDAFCPKTLLDANSGASRRFSSSSSSVPPLRNRGAAARGESLNASGAGGGTNASAAAGAQRSSRPPPRSRAPVQYLATPPESEGEELDDESEDVDFEENALNLFDEEDDTVTSAEDFDSDDDEFDIDSSRRLRKRRNRSSKTTSHGHFLRKKKRKRKEVDLRITSRPKRNAAVRSMQKMKDLVKTRESTSSSESSSEALTEKKKRLHRFRADSDFELDNALDVSRSAPLGPRSYQLLEYPLWVTSVDKLRHIYVPQVGDTVRYFRQGHEESRKLLKSDDMAPYDVFSDFPAVVEAEVSDLEFQRQESLANDNGFFVRVFLQMKISAKDGDSTRTAASSSNVISSSTSRGQRSVEAVAGSALVTDENGILDEMKKMFVVHFFPGAPVSDFLVLSSRVRRSLPRQYRTKYLNCKCEVPFLTKAGESEKHVGKIVNVTPVDSKFEESPWKCLEVRLSNSNSECSRFSPWEVEVVDDLRSKIPDFYEAESDVDPRENPGVARRKIERLSAGISRIVQLEDAEEFVSPVSLMQFPDYSYTVFSPMSLITLRDRAEKGFYRRETALTFDMNLIASNSIVYNGLSQLSTQAAVVVLRCIEAAKGDDVETVDLNRSPALLKKLEKQAIERTEVVRKLESLVNRKRQRKTKKKKKRAIRSDSEESMEEEKERKRPKTREKEREREKVREGADDEMFPVRRKTRASGNSEFFELPMDYREFKTKPLSESKRERKRVRKSKFEANDQSSSLPMRRSTRTRMPVQRFQIENLDSDDGSYQERNPKTIIDVGVYTLPADPNHTGPIVRSRPRRNVLESPPDSGKKYSLRSQQSEKSESDSLSNWARDSNVQVSPVKEGGNNLTLQLKKMSNVNTRRSGKRRR